MTLLDTHANAAERATLHAAETSERERIIELMYAWINQRPGLDARNYISGWNDAAGRSAYRHDARAITRQLNDARRLLRAVELFRVPVETLREAFAQAYSGRLTYTPGRGLDYTVGQYWATEYRAAACAVLASALWAHARERCMPAPTVGTGPDGQTWPLYDGLRAGDYLRRHFRRELGRPLAARWFR